MTPISKEHIRRLNALGAGAGLKERDNCGDDYHAVIFRLTGKTSTKDLTEPEFVTVERELLRLMALGSRRSPLPGPRKSEPPSPPGMISKEQIKKAWGVFYELKALDGVSAAATDRERMQAIIRRSLHVDTTLNGDLFKWLTAEQGHTLIEAIKGMVRSARRKAGAC